MPQGKRSTRSDRNGQPPGRVLDVFRVGTSTVVPLPNTGTLIIGRGEHADVLIDDPAVSREHAKVHVGDEIRLEDLGSSNGTHLGLRRLDPRREQIVRPGVAIGIGDTILMLRTGDDARTVFTDDTSRRSRPSFAPPAPMTVGNRAMETVVALVHRVAQENVDVVLCGETGTGRSLLARTLHRQSTRAEQPCIEVDCTAHTVELGTELLGLGDHESLVDRAVGGTLILREVAALPRSIQPGFLERLAKGRAQGPIRLVSTTSCPIHDASRRGALLPEMVEQLRGLTIDVPPLRERPDEIRLLAETFIDRIAAQVSLPPPPLTSASVDVLEGHDWPGNVEELQRLLERLVLLGDGSPIDTGALPFGPTGGEWSQEDDEWLAERKRIIAALELCSGNQTRAAKRLRMSRRTLVSRMVTHRIPRPHKPLPGARVDTATMPEIEPLGGDASEVAERTRLLTALERCAGNQTRAAKLLGVSRRTLVGKMIRYGIPRPRKPLPPEDEL